MPILRFPILSKPDEFIILDVTPDPSKLPLLNAKLVGTDGYDVYSLQLTQYMVDQALSHKSDMKDEEWTTLLKDVLFTGMSKPDLKVEVQVEEKKNMDIIFYRTIEGGYKQRLGTFSLARTKKESISMFDWCGNLADQVSEMVGKLAEKERKIQMLQRQNEELVKAKNESEKEMMGKCLRLINAKKDKIEELAEIVRKYEDGRIQQPDEMEGIEEPEGLDEVEEEKPVEVKSKKGRGKAAAKGKGKAKAKASPPPAQRSLPARRGRKRAAASPEPEPEPEVEEEQDADENDIETEDEIETESDHSVEDEVPEVRRRAGGHRVVEDDDDDEEASNAKGNKKDRSIEADSTADSHTVKSSTDSGPSQSGAKQSQDNDQGPSRRTTEVNAGKKKDDSPSQSRYNLRGQDDEETESDDEL